jgi:hypothetical protein
MAFTEMDRVALYWPGRAIQKLRNDRQGSCSRSSKTLPSTEAEILEGGCLLFRVFRAADAVARELADLAGSTPPVIDNKASEGGPENLRENRQKVQ